MRTLLRRSWYAIGLPCNGGLLVLGVDHGRPWWVVLGGVGVCAGVVHVWNLEPS